MLAGGSIKMMPTPPIEVGRIIEVFRVDNGFLDFEVDYHICFDDPDELRTKQMVNSLRDFHAEVSRIVRLFDPA
jgi:hypothetical protein